MQPSVYEFLVDRLLLASVAMQVTLASKRLPDHAPGAYQQAYYDKTGEPGAVRNIICDGDFTPDDAQVIRETIGNDHFVAIKSALTLTWLPAIETGLPPSRFTPQCHQKPAQ